MDSDSSDEYYSAGEDDSEREVVVPSKVQQKENVVQQSTSELERLSLDDKKDHASIQHGKKEAPLEQPLQFQQIEVVDPHQEVVHFDASQSSFDISASNSPRSLSPSNSNEMEFTVKNLDTGQSISSKDIEKLIPKGEDPIYSILQRNSEDSTSPTDGKKDKKKDRKSKGKLWMEKVVSRSKSLKESLENPSKKTPKKLFAQISKQKLLHNKTVATPVWVMKFNFDGIFMVSGGKDGIINLWKVKDGNNSTFY